MSLGLVLFGTIVSITLASGVSNNQLYKRLILTGYDWTQFVYKTPDFYVGSKIECGGHCNYQSLGCDLFVYEPDSTACHLGVFENSNKNYLASTGVGENPVYIKIGKYLSTD